MARALLVFVLSIVVAVSVVGVEARRKNHRKIKSREPVPDWDWRTKGAVLPVIDQGQTGNSYAIETAEAVSSFGFIQDQKPLIRASAEEVIDCCLNATKSDRGSWSTLFGTDHVFDCIASHKGLCTDADYPVSPSQQCMANKCTVPFAVDGGVYVQNDVTGIKTAVASNPAVALVNAASVSFQTYVSGVYEDKTCDSTTLDHALLIVGYGTKDGKDVWYCKNSWGANWGEKGYIYIARGENICGIESSVAIPI